MSPLRRRTIEDMTIREVAPKAHVMTSRRFCRSSDTASLQDSRRRAAARRRRERRLDSCRIRGGVIPLGKGTYDNMTTDFAAVHSESPVAASTTLTWNSAKLASYLANRVLSAPAFEHPFPHLGLEGVFPDDIYCTMVEALPDSSDYRPMHGRSRGLDFADGTHTRVKIDLFPEYLRNLPVHKKAIWQLVGEGLRSPEVLLAFKRRLAGPLERRFGPNFTNARMFPIPVLTRDIPGYLIPPHTDTHWKGMTVQLYLPADNKATDIGTIFHEKKPNGELCKLKQIPFVPNSGYAFAVGTDTWHSADKVREDIRTRDSILLTYYVDDGVLRYLRNRGKRVGNFLLNEVKHRSLRSR
jgi:hypothetical protein